MPRSNKPEPAEYCPIFALQMPLFLIGDLGRRIGGVGQSLIEIGEWPRWDCSSRCTKPAVVVVDSALSGCKRNASWKLASALSFTLKLVNLRTHQPGDGILRSACKALFNGGNGQPVVFRIHIFGCQLCFDARDFFRCAPACSAVYRSSTAPSSTRMQ